MESIFKYNSEPNINYDNISIIQIMNILKNLRLNISEEIKCLLFIKQKIEKKESVNVVENNEISEKLIQKYSLILNKLNELCIEEINYISETIIILEKKIKETKINNETDYIKDDAICDKIDLTINNYNKIIENINKTLSSLPYIFNLYLLYNKIEEEENIFIRNNIQEEEKNYKLENDKINNKKKKILSKKEKKTEEIISNREKMIKFSESLKYLNKKKNMIMNNCKNNNKEEKKEVIINKNDLQKNINELIKEKEELKNFIFKNCIKENEIKNFNKMKEENKILNEEINNLKLFFQELNNKYEKENEKFEKLKTERKELESENLKLIEYINNIISKKDIIKDYTNFKNNNLLGEQNNNNIHLVSTQTSNNNCIEYNKNDMFNVNINPNDFESVEMLKRLNKL